MQSCYSYKTIDKNVKSNKIGNIYKIKLGDKKYKGKLIASNDSIATFKIGNSEKNFKTSEIDLIKIREFSVLKTIVFIPSMFLIVAVVSYIVDPKINVPTSPSSPN